MNITQKLSSWNEGHSKFAVLDFVDRITKNGTNYVPPEDRIAVFDNDGTLWCEKPMPIQADFLLRRINEMSQQDPSLKEKQPWKAVSEKDYKWLGGVIDKHYKGDDSDLKLMAGGLLSAYKDISIEQYKTKASQFFKTAQHPTLKRSYLECIFQPMVELMRFLEANGFTNIIVSGGGRDFVRVVSDKIYGIPSDRIIGSSVALTYQDKENFADIFHTAKLDIFDDGNAKPVQIWGRLGKRPILAVGNSNGDIPMLRFCARPDRPSLSMLINHDDGKREFSYVAGAEESLQLAEQYGWTVVSMKNDWNEVFPEQLGTISKAA